MSMSSSKRPMSGNKRLLIVAPYGFNERMSNYVEFVAARLLVKHGWDVYAVAASDDPQNSKDAIDGVEIWHYKNLFFGLFRVLRIFITKNPQIVHIFTLRNNRVGIAAGMLAKLFRRKLFCTEYGLLHDHYLVRDRDAPLGEVIDPTGLIHDLRDIFRGKKPLVPAIKNYLFHWPLTHADTIAFVSSHNMPIAKMLGLKKTTLLPYVFDHARWNARKTWKHAEPTDIQNDAALRKIEGLAGVPYVAFIGQLKLRKGWDVLLNAIALIDKSIIRNFVFVTPSGLNESADFFALVKKLNIHDAIVLMARLNNHELKTVYEKSSAVVIPSRYEGFGLAVVEAWEMKKPVVASDVAAINEHGIDGKNCLLVEPGDPQKLARAMEEVVRDRELAARLVAGGSESFADLQSGSTVDRWLKFYNEAIPDAVDTGDAKGINSII